MFDVIGDIHGHLTALHGLLRALGYRHERGAWRSPGERRRVLFLGDYIDRGPEIPKTVKTVRNMVEAGVAEAILGNHEFNALAWHATGNDGEPLRAHTPSHRRQYIETLRQFGANDTESSAELDAALAWFRQLPIAYQDCTLRAVHAVWDESALATFVGDRPFYDPAVLRWAATPGRPEFEAVERLLKGIEIPLPRSAYYRDKDGVERTHTRIRWWLDLTQIADQRHVPIRKIAMPPVDGGEATIAIDGRVSVPGYDRNRPVFFGHYWLSGTVAPIAEQIACLDYSIADGGVLCAYRFDGERTLTADRFVCVDQQGDPVTLGPR